MSTRRSWGKNVGEKWKVSAGIRKKQEECWHLAPVIRQLHRELKALLLPLRTLPHSDGSVWETVTDNKNPELFTPKTLKPWKIRPDCEHTLKNTHTYFPNRTNRYISENGTLKGTVHFWNSSFINKLLLNAVRHTSHLLTNGYFLLFWFFLLSPSSILDFVLASPVVKLLRSCVLHCSLHRIKLRSETNPSLHLYSFRYDGWRSIHQDGLNVGPAHGRRCHQVKGNTAGTLKRMTEMLNLKNNETL